MKSDKSDKPYEQLAQELHKPAIKKFERRKVVVRRIDEIFGADLVDMNEWKTKKYRTRFKKPSSQVFIIRLSHRL